MAIQTAVTAEEFAGLLVRFVGCPRCGRFNLRPSNISSEHRQGWYRFSCHDCANAVDLPMRVAADGQ
jgi:transposase-like protein